MLEYDSREHTAVKHAWDRVIGKREILLVLETLGRRSYEPEQGNQKRGR